MPIDEAKKLLLQRGLPVRADPRSDPQARHARAGMGESSGGRTIGAPAPAAGTAPPAAARSPRAGQPAAHKYRTQERDVITAIAASG